MIFAGISAFVIAGLFGLMIDRLVYSRLRRKMSTPPGMMIVSLGVSMVLRALLFMRFSAGTFRFVPDRDWRLGTSTFEIPTVVLQLRLGDRIGKPLIELADNVNP